MLLLFNEFFLFLGVVTALPLIFLLLTTINITIIMTTRQEFKDMYYHFKKAFGIDSPGWDMIHRNYSPSMFCPENRLNLTSEYLTWKWLIPYLKKYDVVYYCGIDDFLAEYERAVESRVNLD